MFPSPRFTSDHHFMDTFVSSVSPKPFPQIVLKQILDISVFGSPETKPVEFWQWGEDTGTGLLFKQLLLLSSLL